MSVKLIQLNISSETGNRDAVNETEPRETAEIQFQAAEILRALATPSYFFHFSLFLFHQSPWWLSPPPSLSLPPYRSTKCSQTFPWTLLVTWITRTCVTLSPTERTRSRSKTANCSPWITCQSHFTWNFTPKITHHTSSCFTHRFNNKKQ